jgi:hypothetical protein
VGTESMNPSVKTAALLLTFALVTLLYAASAGLRDIGGRLSQ